ncbi:MAG TPA: DinB family protein [Candidatus Limnocylindrales bacterium]|jgi:uncharacterized damage-inducible protein DinB
MTPDDVRFLYAYDKWATQRVLNVLDGVSNDVWSNSSPVGERRLGAILVHQLGAAQRWREAFMQTGETSRPEREPLLSVDELRRRWRKEWEVLDGWLPTIDQDLLDHVDEGVPIWQMILHVTNHGTQHRSEAAALLTEIGHSPGDLDMWDLSEAQAKATATR